MMNLLNKLCLLAFLFFSVVSCDSEEKTVEKNIESPSLESKLLKHTVLSDSHPMRVWEKKASNPKGAVLLIHGRTWSSLPNFDLQVEGENLSFMDAMVQQQYSAYALDLRGYGGTPRDSTEWLSPDKAAADILNVLSWISEENGHSKVHLFGYSMGSTSSLLATQKNSENIASLTLFGYWQDLDSPIPADPVDHQLKKETNTAKAAASDFITPGNISQKAIDAYVRMSLEHDPIRVDWRLTNQFNSIDPTAIETPVLILQGALDPIAPTERQAKLFTRLKTNNKAWVVIAGGDHAAFLENSRDHLIQSYISFIDRFNSK